MDKYQIIGLMSGTSLDGLDIAHCTFTLEESWLFTINEAETIPYDESLKAAIENVYHGSALDLIKTDHLLGDWIGQQVKKFISKHEFHADLIVSPGQTIFHQPENGFTCQLGNGWEIVKNCDVPVIADLRSIDISFGGQGAPLVPIGDQLLFRDYASCLNLGGFSNISYQQEKLRIAFDICPVNMVLNHLAMRLGMPFDKNGQKASEGRLLNDLLLELNDLNFYHQSPPKSLGFEWVEANVFPLLKKSYHPADLLNTYCHHIAIQIDRVLRNIRDQHQNSKNKMLVTGGGAFNYYLISLFQQYSSDIVTIEVPDNQLISFKEALIFAFLGLLRWRKEINILSSVTGAGKDLSGGVIYELVR